MTHEAGRNPGDADTLRSSAEEKLRAAFWMFQNNEPMEITVRALRECLADYERVALARNVGAAVEIVEER